MGLSRQELYEQIKASSKDGYILAEMQRLGFWTESEPQPARELIARKAEIQQEIASLSAKIKDPEAALKLIHKQRMAAALEKRLQTRINRELKRFQSAHVHHQNKQKKLITLGDAAHFGTTQQAIQSEKLKALGLPEIDSALELAEQAGITLNELRFLTYSRRVSKLSHYQRFEMAKKIGGTRLISAPMPRLKRLQYWILERILNPLPVTPAAHGFVPKKGILSNARPHIGKKVVINLDLKDFFPTISYPRVKGLFLSLGYGNEVATLLSLLCTEAESQQVEIDGQRYFIAAAQRRLPQGSPCSPAISNQICKRLDKRLAGLAQKWNFAYTRYADDLTFSADSSQYLGALFKGLRQILKAEGFVLHPDKTRIMHKGARQEVTGLVVNQGLSVSAATLKRFRALLFQLEKDGLQGKTWAGHTSAEPGFLERLQGFAQYIRLVQPEKGQKLCAHLQAIRQKYPDTAFATATHSNQVHSRKSAFRQKSANAELPLPGQHVAPVPPPPKLAEIILDRGIVAEVEAAWKNTTQATQEGQA